MSTLEQAIREAGDQANLRAENRALYVNTLLATGWPQDKAEQVVDRALVAYEATMEGFNKAVECPLEGPDAVDGMVALQVPALVLSMMAAYADGKLELFREVTGMLGMQVQ